MRPFGIHISGGQHLGSNLQEAVNAGFSAVQIFLGNPQKMDLTPLPPGEIALFRRIKNNSGIKVYVHAPYVLHVFAKPENVSKNNNFLSKMNFVAADLGCDGLVVHMGGTKWYEIEAYPLVARQFLEDIGPSQQACPILFENCANGNDMSGNLAVIAQMIEQLNAKPFNVGLCMDTLHAWAWGYDYRENKPLAELITERVYRQLRLLHLNSGPEKVQCGGKYDRHECIHKGVIPQDCFQWLLRCLPGIPVIIEGHDYSDMLSDCAFVKAVDEENAALPSAMPKGQFA